MGEIGKTYAALQDRRRRSLPARSSAARRPTSRRCTPTRPMAVNGSTIYTGMISADRQRRRRHPRRDGQLPEGVQPDPPARRRQAGRRRRRRRRRRLRSLPARRQHHDAARMLDPERPRRRRRPQRDRQLPRRSRTPIRPTATATARATSATRARCDANPGTPGLPGRRSTRSRPAWLAVGAVVVGHRTRSSPARLRPASSCRSRKATPATRARTTRASSCSSRRRPVSVGDTRRRQLSATVATFYGQIELTSGHRRPTKSTGGTPPAAVTDERRRDR